MSETLSIKILADNFSEALQKDLSEADFNELVKLNKTSKSAYCLSHDYTDANGLMAICYEKLFDENFDPTKQAHMNILNKAWTLARKNNFKNTA